MGQQEYDNFKEEMKQWMLENSDIYDQFEDTMNSQSEMGYQLIMAQAINLVPQYSKLLAKKKNSRNIEDIADVECLFNENNLGETIVSSFNTKVKKSIVPAMICWLFFGKSFETMVENLEILAKDTTLSTADRITVTQTIKLMVEKSISLGIRTAEDWSKYKTLREVVDNSNTLEWALNSLKENQQKEATPLHRPEEVSVFENMLLLDSEKKTELLSKIGAYLNTGVKGKRVAFMILALRQLGYLPEVSSERQLFTALKSYYNIHIGSDKGIYSYLESGTYKQFKEEIDNLIVHFNVD